MRSDTWPEERAETWNELVGLITVIKQECGWRGHARSEWILETSLDRLLRKDLGDVPYDVCLSHESAIIEQFRSLSRPYGDHIDKTYLDDPKLGSIALGQHAGLPTRLLDWTASPWVAAWFACHEHPGADGVIWWFDSARLEHEVGRHWDTYSVRYRDRRPHLEGWSEEERRAYGLAEREIEHSAFAVNGTPWISKLYFKYQCARMEAQQGFHTIGGRLRVSHDEAIDVLASHPLSDGIPRGRVTISSSIKAEVIKSLRRMNIHAKSLQYPGLDIAARTPVKSI